MKFNSVSSSFEILLFRRARGFLYIDLQLIVPHHLQTVRHPFSEEKSGERAFTNTIYHLREVQEHGAGVHQQALQGPGWL